MAKAHDVFSLLILREAEIRSSGQAWMQFLKSSAYTSKYSFNDQLLIYAHRPDAKACASMAFWNKKFKRWVNKGAKGIPLLEMMDDGNYRIKYVFDLADTHPTKYTEQDVQLFSFNEANHLKALEGVENQVGITDGDSMDLMSRIMSLSEKYTAYYQDDMVADIKQLVEDTYLEELDSFNIEVMSKKLLRHSVAFQMMERLDLATESYFSGIDFGDITDFNDVSLTTTLATTINETTLEFMTDIKREISKTETRQKNVLNDMEKHQDLIYNKEETNKTKIMSSIDKGGHDDESRNVGRDPIPGGQGRIYTDRKDNNLREGGWDLSDGRGSANSQLTANGQAAGNDRDVRTSEKEIPRREQAINVFKHDDQGYSTESSEVHRPTSSEFNRDGNTQNDGQAEGQRGNEEAGPNEMGRAHEQHQNDSRGDHLQGNRLQVEQPIQLSLFPTEEEQLQIISETVDDEATVFSFHKQKLMKKS